MHAGYDALLLESNALGAGQSIQAQGIIHGGGKYALRGVHDFEAVKAIREMPESWRRHLRGEEEPDLSAARVLCESCLLWVPKAGLWSRLNAYAFLPVVKKAGLLHAGPVKLESGEWPEALRGSARVVYSMAEPVLATGSILAALAGRHPQRLLRYAPGTELKHLRIDLKIEGQHEITIEDPEIEEPLRLRARAVVYAAGAGNEALVRQSEAGEVPMQRRPLRMLMLRGPLPTLYGHMVSGGKTAMTVTTHPLPRVDRPGESAEKVWQVGGELAERFAERGESEELRVEFRRHLSRFLPGLDFSRVSMASYSAVRAEARSRDLRRPSGVQVKRLGPRALVAWPTKMALAPVLAREVASEVNRDLGPPARKDHAGPERGSEGRWPRPELAKYPWEEGELTWRPVL